MCDGLGFLLVTARHRQPFASAYAGAVSATTTPLANSTTRPPIEATSAASWLATITVTPTSLNCRNKPMTLFDSAGSKLPVGSSASSTLGAVDDGAGDSDALPLAGGKVAGQQPLFAEQSYAGQRGAHSSCRVAAFHAGHLQRQRDVVEDAALRQQMMFLKDHAQTLPIARQMAPRELADIHAVDEDSPLG